MFHLQNAVAIDAIKDKTRHHDMTSTLPTVVCVCACVRADLPVSGTSVGLMMRLICSMDCRSGERPVGDTETSRFVNLFRSLPLVPVQALTSISKKR